MITIRSTDIVSKYFGDTEAKIRKVFQVAHQTSPCVLFFDEFDSLAHKRLAFYCLRLANAFSFVCRSLHDSGESSHGNIYNRILSTFLNELDGISLPTISSSSSNSLHSRDVLSQFVFVIVACKTLDVLDDALIRPG
jgi:SpoVK/Ycf46/Vps4 family AAA+-type ATPase